MTLNSKKQRGAALWLTVLVTLVILVFFVGSILSGARSQTNLTGDEMGEMQAHYAAMGAISKAFIFLEDNPDWEGSWEQEPMSQNPNILHSLESDRSHSGIGPSEIYLRAQGFTRAHGPGTPLAAVGGTAFRPSGGIQHAFFAGRSLMLEACNVDAYNASLGIGYLPQPGGGTLPVPSPSPTLSPGATPLYSGVPGGAAVGANREVTLQNTVIDDMIVLPQAGIVLNSGVKQGQGAVLNQNSSSYNSIDRPEKRLDLPATKVPLGTGSASVVIDSGNWASLAVDSSEVGGRILAPGVYRSVTVPDGGKLAFAPGEYYFEDGFFAVARPGNRIKLKLTTENTLTKLFVGGAFHLEGVDFRPVESGDPTAIPPIAPPATIAEPEHLRIYGAGLGTGTFDTKICNVSIRDTKLTGLILGEAVEGSFQACEIWGAVMGRTIEARNVNMHYDTSLASIKLAEHSRWKLRGLTKLFTPPPAP